MVVNEATAALKYFLTSGNAASLTQVLAALPLANEEVIRYHQRRNALEAKARKKQRQR